MGSPVNSIRIASPSGIIRDRWTKVGPDSRCRFGSGMAKLDFLAARRMSQYSAISMPPAMQ